MRQGERHIIFGESEKALSEEKSGVKSRMQNLEWLGNEVLYLIDKLAKHQTF